MADYNTISFVEDLEQFGIVLTEYQIEQFLRYFEILVEENKVMNLTAITEYDEVIKKHFVDSLSLVKTCDLTKNLKLIDVGTGAGFPGIPLKIVFPNIEITLLDSLNKRVTFLNKVIDELNLENIEALHGRAEDYGKKILREKYDLCVSRAVANLSTLSEYCLPFVKVGGLFISYKSEKITEEKNIAEQAISILGGTVLNQVEFTLPNSNIFRNLFVIKKIKETPNKFPRKAGLPSKEPLT